MAKYTSFDEVPEAVKAKVARYFTNLGGDTFCIIGLPPELAGGAMARYSRAPTGIQLTIINEFLDENGDPSAEKGSALMDRVLNAFGDESVGELEGAHVGIENVSNLLTKCIEDRRIGGSPIEQSSRYVKYDIKAKDGGWRYLRPREIMESGLGAKFEEVNNMAFDLYSRDIKALSGLFRKLVQRDTFTIKVPRGEDMVEVREADLQSDSERRAFKNAYNFTVRCAALDVGRCVLPSSTLTHLGLLGNGRFYTNLITRLKSEEFEEMRERGCRLEEELAKVIPTYIQRNRDNPKLIRERQTRMKAVADELFRGVAPDDGYVTLLPREPLAVELLGGALYPYTNLSLAQIRDVAIRLSPERQQEILDTYVGEREDRRDRTPRGYEAGYPLTFDLVGCFAEFRDLQRHRMLTQQRQRLGTDLGFIVPPEMGEVGLDKEAEEIAQRMADLNSDLRHAGLDAAAQYATLFNNRLRFSLGMVPREAQHLCELRTIEKGHFSYRAMAQEMTRKILAEHPLLKSSLAHVNWSDPGNKIARAQEQARIAGKNLKAGIDGSVDFTETEA